MTTIQGRVIWAVRRHDVGDDPVIYTMDDLGGGGEEAARSMVAYINRVCDAKGWPERKAELLRCQLQWEVVPDG